MAASSPGRPGGVDGAPGDPMSGTCIIWPDPFAPALAAVHVVNEMRMARTPAQVWARLVRAADWPRWYRNARDVRVEGGGPDLFLGARLAWRTFGVSLTSHVAEFVPGERLAWTAHGPALACYHAWIILPDPGGGCLVRTEETQNGIVARVGRLCFPRRMERWHQRWLEGLALPGLREEAPASR